MGPIEVRLRPPSRPLSGLIRCRRDYCHPENSDRSVPDKRRRDRVRRAVDRFRSGSPLAERILNEVTPGPRWHAPNVVLVSSVLHSGWWRLETCSSECRKPSCAINSKPADQIPPPGSQNPEDQKRVCNFQKWKQYDGKGKVDQEHQEPSPTALRSEQPHLRRHAKAHEALTGPFLQRARGMESDRRRAVAASRSARWASA